MAETIYVMLREVRETLFILFMSRTLKILKVGLRWGSTQVDFIHLHKLGA
ncbi:MAG: hypothetical protein AAGF85_10075 [Bacteroidota bacterium]